MVVLHNQTHHPLQNPHVDYCQKQINPHIVVGKLKWIPKCANSFKLLYALFQNSVINIYDSMVFFFFRHFGKSLFLCFCHCAMSVYLFFRRGWNSAMLNFVNIHKPLSIYKHLSLSLSLWERLPGICGNTLI